MNNNDERRSCRQIMKIIANQQLSLQSILSIRSVKWFINIELSKVVQTALHKRAIHSKCFQAIISAMA